MSGLRLAFMGSPAFAVPALGALVEAGHTVAAVYCQPPRPAGRGQAMRACAVQVAAEVMGLAVRTPARLRREPEAAAAFAALELDAAVVAAYGLILPPEVLAAPRLGCLNIHASLLPRWRGASPMQAAILAGDAQTGVTIMQMDAGLDTGPMVLAEAVALDGRATTPWLHDVLAAMGGRLIVRALAGPMEAVAQPAEATYAAKLTRADGVLDWSRPAAVLDRQVRALNPWPGTETLLGGAGLKILAAELAAGGGVPGTVLEDFTVACGEGALRVTRVQAPGRPAMAAEAFLRGRKLPPGTVLGALP